jgi:hypothetical protein
VLSPSRALPRRAHALSGPPQTCSRPLGPSPDVLTPSRSRMRAAVAGTAAGARCQRCSGQAVAARVRHAGGQPAKGEGTRGVWGSGLHGCWALGIGPVCLLTRSSTPQSHVRCCPPCTAPLQHSKTGSALMDMMDRGSDGGWARDPGAWTLGWLWDPGALTLGWLWDPGACSLAQQIAHASLPLLFPATSPPSPPYNLGQAPGGC